MSSGSQDQEAPDPWLVHNDQQRPGPAQAGDTEAGADRLTVELRRRTLEERVEYLLMHVALLTATVTRMEHDAEALILAIKSLENRTLALESKPHTGRSHVF